ncbi:MAG: hypothetical protein P1V51_20425 [Deltaproteobacteria bacterium]|nr:hypothetical protein [Deltaproteobacteria bacterium]
MNLDPSKRPPPAVVLLGAQRYGGTVVEEVRHLEVSGRIALVTAGWQEREAEDQELRSHLEADAVNLELHRRAEEVFAADPELAAAHRTRQQMLRHKQDFYRVRLEFALEADHVIRQRTAPPEVLRQEEEASLAAIRALDEYHLGQCDRVHAEFEAAMKPANRPALARQREEVAELIAGSSALAIAGGHVASLVNRLRMFGVASALDGQLVFAWSAGAMALTERIVLFHDDPPQGPGASEILDRGLGLVPSVVALPQPETRLRLEDPERVGVLASRFAPAACLTLAAGAHVTFRDGRPERPSGVMRLDPEGTCEPLQEVPA